MSEFATHAIGRTGLRVSRLGFGAAPIANLGRVLDEATALATIEAAYAGASAILATIRYFDTAPFYGYGLNEHRIGHVLRNRPRADYVLSTKVGCLLTPKGGATGPDNPFPGALPFACVWDYSHDAVMRSFEDSLQRLGEDRVDILLIHGLGPVTHGADHERIYRTAMDGAYRVIARLKNEGTVAAIGLGVEEWEVCLDAMRDGDFDCILMAGRYTLLEQATLDFFLPECERRDVSVVIGGPFNSGILAKGAVQGATYEYAVPPTEVPATFSSRA